MTLHPDCEQCQSLVNNLEKALDEEDWNELAGYALDLDWHTNGIQEEQEQEGC